MFQQPPQRRTLNQVKSNSAYVNYSNSQGSPMNVGYGQDAHSYDNGGYQNKTQHNRKQARGGGVPCLFFLVWTVLLLGGPYIYFEYFLLPEMVTDVTKEEVDHTKHHWMTKYHSLQVSYESLEKSHTELKQKHDELERNHGGHAENSQELERQLHESHQQLDQERQWALDWKNKAIGLEEADLRLRQTIQEYSRRQLIQRYGYRTLEVELELNFGGDDNAWVTIELAPIDEMPHTVYTFMEQVSQGLYNDGGFSFHHNGAHIVMGAPFSNHLTPEGVDNYDKFNSHGISNVLIQEYSESFPHQRYSLGLAGRPGGPNFYINMRDNTAVHGPGGYSEDGQADPCFGRITRGHDVIDRIHGMTGELHEGDWKEIQPFVAVRWAKIM